MENRENILPINLHKVGAALAIALGILGLVREDTRVAASVEQQNAILLELKTDVKKQGDDITGLKVSVAKLQVPKEPDQ